MAVPNNAGENFWNSIAPGFRFKPFDEELITYYLENKVYGRPLPLNKIHDVELYGEYGPQDLAEKYDALDKDTWYYFTRRERKYENGDRPSRTAGNGFWKATGKDEDIKNDQGQLIGKKKTLAYFFGKQIEGNVKSEWLMQEFKLNDVSIKEKKTGNSKSKKLPKGAGTADTSQPKPKLMLDGYVLCKVYCLNKGKKSSPVVGEKHEVVQQQAMEQTTIASNQNNGKGKKRSRVASPVAREEYQVPLQFQHQEPQVMEQTPVVNHEDISVPTLASSQSNMFFQQPYVRPHQHEPSSQVPYELQGHNYVPNQSHMLQPDKLTGSTALEHSVQPSPLQRTDSLDFFEGLLDFMIINGPKAIQGLSSNPAC